MTQVAGNYLLEQFSESDLRLLIGHLHETELVFGKTLYEPEDPIDRVIFPKSGLLSIISVMEGGATAETSMVGRNGGVGFIEAYGSRRMNSRVVVQGPGKAWVVSAQHYRNAFDASATFRRAVEVNTELQLAETRQNLACCSLHRADVRMIRWLLDLQDISGIDGPLPMTQEFLSGMIGVQRTTITGLLLKLQDQGLVRQFRGRIEILSREKMEARACECRRFIGGLRASIQPGAPEVHIPGQL